MDLPRGTSCEGGCIPRERPAKGTPCRGGSSHPDRIPPARVNPSAPQPPWAGFRRPGWGGGRGGGTSTASPPWPLQHEQVADTSPQSQLRHHAQIHQPHWAPLQGHSHAVSWGPSLSAWTKRSTAAPGSLHGPFTLEAPSVTTVTSDLSPALTSDPLPTQEAFFPWRCLVACGILVPQPGMRLAPPVLKAHLNHRTTGEVPRLSPCGKRPILTAGPKRSARHLDPTHLPFVFSFLFP